MTKLLTPESPGYAGEVTGHNLDLTPSPALVMPAESVEDVVAAVRRARDEGLTVAVRGTGHGPPIASDAGMLITTGRFSSVEVDPESRMAEVGAGTPWSLIVEAAAEHVLAPITGSATGVACAGYILGGGLGPLASSHGFSSDYVESFSVVTGEGDVVEASADSDPDLYWALRGGKAGLPIVTGMTLQLVELETLYAGSLMFAEGDIETAMPAWVAWTADADPRVTTSTAIIRFPPLDVVPEPMRGRTLLSLRFAYPGDPSKGERLAEPLRSAAPVYLDGLGELPVSQIATIHNDPVEPASSWISARLLDSADDAFVDRLMSEVGPAADAPFVSVEVRHLGGATSTDVPGGSAVAGRAAAYSLGMIGLDPEENRDALDAASDRVLDQVWEYVSERGNPNFTAPLSTEEAFAKLWEPAEYRRLKEIRRRYDPAGTISFY